MSSIFICCIFIMEYCSPSKKNNYKTNGTCFDENAIRRIVRAYNQSNPSNLISINKPFKKQLQELHERFESKCKNNESCIISSLRLDNDEVIDDYVRPKMPYDWKNDPNMWLTNFNIEAILIQYEDAYRPFYKFFGVYSADFLRRLSNGQPAHPELAHINLESLFGKGIRTFGFVINLDNHDEPGSHWTSLFACIDPSMQCYGVYYYDSVASNPPEDMIRFMDMLKDRCGKKFKKRVNKKRQQYGSSECGIFSIYNQIKWMHESKNKNGKITFSKLMSEKETDKKMSDLRRKLFRPLDLKI